MKNSITVDGVVYYKHVVTEAEIKLKTIKEVISRFRSALEEQVQDAEQIYKELTEDGLKFNSIEAEGNLRGWITAKNLVEYHFGEVDEQCN